MGRTPLAPRPGYNTLEYLMDHRSDSGGSPPATRLTPGSLSASLLSVYSLSLCIPFRFVGYVRRSEPSLFPVVECCYLSPPCTFHIIRIAQRPFVLSCPIACSYAVSTFT